MKPQTAPAAPIAAPATSTGASRVGILLYGVASYAVGLFGLTWLILACLGVAPLGAGPLALQSPAAALAFDLGLVALFGVQHAIMARPWFKERWTRVIPAAAERSTFVLVTGVLTAAMMWFWQPAAGTAWSVESSAAALAIRGVAVLGWGYLLAASFAIDHFELFGLKQVWRNFTGKEQPRVPMVARFMYRFDRHPIMTGMLIGLWATPTMSMTQLVLAAGLTAYIVVGVAIEERTLVQVHGERYESYRRRVAALVPLPGRRA